MIASGKGNPADTGKYQFYIGNFAYEAGDYPGAITGLQAAIAAGYKDNQIDVLLADSYSRTSSSTRDCRRCSTPSTCRRPQASRCR